MLEKLKSKVLLRVFSVVAGVALLSWMVLPMLGLFNGNKSQTQQTSNSSAQAKQLEQIAQGYETVLKREPNNVSALQGLAEARITLQDFSRAIEPVKKLNTIDPNNIQYIAVLTQLYEKTNDVSGASELTPKVEKLIKSEPNNPQYIMILSQLYRQTNNPKSTEIKKQVEKLVQSEPNNLQYLQLLAQLRLQTNDLPGALTLMKKLQQSYPQDEQLKMAVEKLEETVAQQNQAIPIPLPSPSNKQK